MSFQSLFQRSRISIALSTAAIATTFALSYAPSTIAQSMTTETTTSSRSTNPINDLSSAERAALLRGEVLVAGGNGDFSGQVLVNASIEEAWEVLTDYDNFENFLPNITSSALLESADNRNVFEQVNEFRVLPFVTTRSRVQIESIESYPQQVQFSLVDGDLESLDGVWILETVPTGEGDRVLVSHRVKVDPGNASPRGIFYSTYKSMLEGSLEAAKREAESRSAAAAAL